MEITYQLRYQCKTTIQFFTSRKEDYKSGEKIICSYFKKLIIITFLRVISTLSKQSVASIKIYDLC